MRVVRQRAKYMPCLNSYFITEYNDLVVDTIKSIRDLHIGGDKYIGNKTWEVTEQIWEKIKCYPHTFVDNSVERPCPLVLEINENNPLGKYHYQEEAAVELRNRTEALLFFDTGTGKTRTSLLALSALKSTENALIVVGEANLSKEWLAQVQKHYIILDKKMQINCLIFR